MGSLCRRALHLSAKRGDVHPSWADCASRNADQLIQGPSGWLREVESTSASAALSARFASAALAVKMISSHLTMNWHGYLVAPRLF